MSARAEGLVRVLIGEPATRGRHASVADQLQNAIAKLLDMRCSAADSVDVLCRVMARQLGGDQLPGPSLTLIDLYESGRADIACRAAPPVLHVRADAPVDAAECAGSGGVESDLIHADLGDHLVALSPGSIQVLAADEIMTIPKRAKGVPHPCRLRDDLLEAVDSRGSDLPAAPIAIMRRQSSRGATDQ